MHPRTQFTGRISTMFEDTTEKYKPSHPIVFVVITNEYHRNAEGESVESTHSWLCKTWPVNKNHFESLVSRLNIGNLIEISAEVRFGYYQDPDTGAHKYSPYMNITRLQTHQQLGEKSQSAVRENDVEIDYHSRMHETPKPASKPKTNKTARGRVAPKQQAETVHKLDDDLPF